MRSSYLQDLSCFRLLLLRKRLDVTSFVNNTNLVLFDLFDFNEIQSISLVDLEFCLQCVVISTSKIYEIGEDVSDQEVHQLVDTSFPRGARLSIIQLI